MKDWAGGDQPARRGEMFDLFTSQVESWAIVALDSEGHVASWNVGAERLLGFKAEEIVGEQFSILFTQQDLEGGKPAQELRQAARLGKYKREGCAVRKDGSVFWAEAVCFPLGEQGGAVSGFARVIHELTWPKAEEEALQLCLEIWDNLPEGLLVFSPEYDSGGRALRILAANAAVLQVACEGGLSVNQLSGARWSDVAEAFHPLLSEDVANSIWSVIASGKPMNLGYISRHTNDAPETAFALRAFPLPHDCAGLLFENIAETQRVEAALAATVLRYQSFIEAVPHALIIMDRTGRIAYANRRTELLLGFGSPELCDSPADLLFAEPFREQFFAQTMVVLANPRAHALGVELRLRARRRDGTDFPAACSLNPWLEGDELWVGVTIRDLGP